MIINKLKSFKANKIITAIALVTALTGSASTIYHLGNIEPGSFKSKAKLAEEFTSLGKVGIISNYWNSYSNSFANPYMIKATPYELSYAVRNAELIDSVFSQPRIFLIRDNWLDTFPSQIKQFDRILIRIDSSFSIGGCTVNEYYINRNWEFNARELKYQPDLLIYDHTLENYVIKVGENYQNCIYKYLVYGPYMTLLPGKYEVGFSVRVDSLLTTNRDIAKIDVVAEYGMKKLASMMLRPSIVPGIGDFHDYRLEFELSEKYNNIEFRIYYFGNAMLTFDEVGVRWII